MKIKEEWEQEGKWKDYYRILNVEPNCNQDTLKKNYRNLLKKYHPDLYPGEEKAYQEKIQIINEAYHILSNLDKRKRYDDDYKIRMNGKNTTNSKKTNNQENFQSNMNNQTNYTKEEYEEARRQSIFLIIRDEKKKIPLINNTIDELLLNTYLNKIDENDYLQSFNVIVNSISNLINNFKVLKQETSKLNMSNEHNEILDIMNELTNKINGIPKTKKIAYDYVLKQLEKEDILRFSRQISDDVVNLLQKFDDLIEQVSDGHIIEENFDYTVNFLLEKIDEKIKLIDKYKTNASKYGLNDSYLLLEQLENYINQKIQSFPKNYEIAKITNSENERRLLKEILKKLQDIDKKHDIELVLDKIELLAEKKRLEYYIDNMVGATTEIDKEVITLKSQLMGLRIKQSELDKARRNYGFSSYQRLFEKRWHEQFEIMESIEFQLACSLAQQTEEKYLICNLDNSKSLYEQELIKKEAEYEGIKIYIEQVSYIDNYKYCDSLCESKIDKCNIIYDLERLKYYVKNRKNAKTESDKKVIALQSELKGHDAKYNALLNEIKNTTFIRQQEKCAKLMDKETRLKKMKQVKLDLIVNVKEYFDDNNFLKRKINRT